MFDETNDEEFVLKIKQESNKIKAWKEKLEEFISKNPEGTLFSIIIQVKVDDGDSESLNYDDINEQLKALKNEIDPLVMEYNEELTKYTDLHNEFQTLDRIYKSCDWISSSILIKRNAIEKSEAVEFEDLKQVIDQM
mmetsp:Transcript_36730/g.32955  ORF Transcript_36730/g.32955 Transcript_36730/m.32955 type:complete len:137 (+) Transcript_36730:290-700(+)|eukprot:CAMPEP_0114598956 /NCGR_PEP_ID=MMETSP0125-20121206/21398_1 /TAXON_ID=485358 ORGANISM="Aristerostoma sp., Strain ATCC 50986" /NCGR_SAMPLE_ID=MMETSP0125 /ASSEMBLY_ACC=CAM_ASM_000245 /LENGTH=136 /DNA_ID=CAMNT_0001805349 /DNA_START=202 /DNA_END=612 /DNA_ORIENTATION=+